MWFGVFAFIIESVGISASDFFLYEKVKKVLLVLTKTSKFGGLLLVLIGLVWLGFMAHQPL